MVQHPKISILVGALALALTSGCAFLKSASPQRERFDCMAEALAPLVGDVLNAEDVLRDVYTGKGSLDAVASFLHLTQAQRTAFNAAVDQCGSAITVPEAELTPDNLNPS